MKTVTCTVEYNNITTIETTNINVQGCPGNIVGSFKDELGAPIAGYNARLFPDLNDDGIADAAAIRSVFSTAAGTWSMASIPAPGIYILEIPLFGAGVLLSIVDSGIFEPTMDPLTPVVAPSNPAYAAFRIEIRQNLIEGRIDIVLDL